MSGCLLSAMSIIWLNPDMGAGLPVEVIWASLRSVGAKFGIACEISLKLPDCFCRRKHLLVKSGSMRRVRRFLGMAKVRGCQFWIRVHFDYAALGRGSPLPILGSPKRFLENCLTAFGRREHLLVKSGAMRRIRSYS